MTSSDKPLVWLEGEIKSPPFSRSVRIEAGYLLRILQLGEKLEFPHIRRMSLIGPRCYELRIPDEHQTWRIILRLDPDVVVIAEVFSKKTSQTPKYVIKNSKVRLKKYDDFG
jgi:phage-related protein